MKKENYLLKHGSSKLNRFTFFLLSLVMMLPLLVNAQENKVEDNYLDYFSLPRESLFLHTNKTTYLVGEEIWFKIYTYDRKNENSSKATSNVYLGLYDETGKQINKQLILTKDGAGHGSFLLKEDLELASGDYFLKIGTNWMKNFKENDEFAQKISIINPKIDPAKVKYVSQKEYDIQFLPEGGHMVAEIRNVIGVKAIDDKGKGTKASGFILDSKGDELTRFTTNSLGLGKFSFVPEEGENYTAKIFLENSKEVTQDLPINDAHGIAVQVDNLRDDKVIVSINTNRKSFNRLKDQAFKLMLHKDGKIKTSKVILSSTSEKIFITRDDLFKGVNIVTLFNEQDQPLVERMFFNSIDLNAHDVEVKNVQKVGDSIYYAFTPKQNLENQVLNASISVLPTGTESYNPEHNIISAIHLKPYLRGAIEQPRYYFTGNEKKNNFELDVLLLTQGWSRYSWDNIFFNTPDPNFDFENGITVNGHLNTDVEDIKSVLLYPSDENRAAFLNFDERGKFHLNNFYPIKGENIKISYVNKKGKTKKPGLALSFLKRMDEDVLDVNQFQSYESFYKYKNDIPEGFFKSEREVLDEIKLNAKLLQRKKARKYRLPFAGRLENISKDLYTRYADVQEYIASKGVWIPGPNQVSTLGLANAQFFATGIGMNSNNFGLNQLNPWGGGFTGFFIDNRPVPLYTLLARPLTDFEDIYIWQTTRVLNPLLNNSFLGPDFGVNQGVNVRMPIEMNTVFGGGLTIRAFTRKTPVQRFELKNQFQSFTTVNYGFEPVKKFYTPKYYSYQMEEFEDYGIIHWEPNATIMSGRLNALKMIDTGLEEISFYIEGISSDGNVFSQLVRLDKSTED